MSKMNIKSRYMTVECVGGQRKLMHESDIKTMYESFRLPVPEMNRPVMSMEFRKAVAERGLIAPTKDNDEEGVVEYMLPLSILNMKFHVFSDAVTEEECESRMLAYINCETYD